MHERVSLHGNVDTKKKTNDRFDDEIAGKFKSLFAASL